MDGPIYADSVLGDANVTLSGNSPIFELCLSSYLWNNTVEVRGTQRSAAVGGNGCACIVDASETL